MRLKSRLQKALLFTVGCSSIYSVDACAAYPYGFGNVVVETVESVPGDKKANDSDTGFPCGDVIEEQRKHEQLSYSDLKALLPELAANNVRVTLAIQAHKLEQYFANEGNSAAMDEIAEVIKAGAPGQVMPWLVLGWCDGYFPGASNYAVYTTAAKLLDRWWRLEQGFAPNEFLIDMELRWSRTQKLNAEDNAAERIALLSSWVNSTEFDLATMAYANLANELKALGWRIVGSTAGHLLDDFIDGDDDLLQAFGTPLVGIAWDKIEWQLYRTLYQQQLPWGSPQLSNFMIYDYLANTAERVMAQHFNGAELGVIVGLTDSGLIYSSGGTYNDVLWGQGISREVQLDADAARLAGVPPAHISVYSLYGLHSVGLENLRVRSPWRIPLKPPVFDGATGILHTLSYGLDTLL